MVEPLGRPPRSTMGVDGSKSTAASFTTGGDGADDSESTTAAVTLLVIDVVMMHQPLQSAELM